MELGGHEKMAAKNMIQQLRRESTPRLALLDLRMCDNETIFLRRLTFDTLSSIAFFSLIYNTCELKVSYNANSLIRDSHRLTKRRMTQITGKTPSTRSVIRS